MPVAFEIEAQAKEIIPDLSGSADILLEAHEDVVLVPKDAIQSEGQQQFVYVKEGDSRAYVKQAVETGQSNSTHTAILSGVDEGDEIALRPPVQI